MTARGVSGRRCVPDACLVIDVVAVDLNDHVDAMFAALHNTQPATRVERREKEEARVRVRGGGGGDGREHEKRMRRTNGAPI